MGAAVKIKEVEGQEIWVQETTISKYNFKALFCEWICFMVIFLLLSYIFILPLPIIRDLIWTHQIIFAIFTSGSFAAMPLISSDFPPFVELYPVYEVFIKNPQIPSIIIPKTSIELDQIAICNAQKELEIICINNMKPMRELELIAKNCK